MTTTLPNIARLKREWVIIDATDQPLGRLASRIALMLRGKHKVTYTPFFDTGDFVVVVNVEKIGLSGQKRSQKIYQRYSGYPSGRRTRTMDQVLNTHPDRVLRQAVKGMMPEGPLGRRMFSKLKVYPGPNHPHAAQQPQPLSKLL